MLGALTAAIFGLEVGFGVLGDFGGEVLGLEVRWAVCLRGSRALWGGLWVRGALWRGLFG